ncbi:MAG: hypothetical protein ACMXYG_05085 [Candidatus Woesearchaeota archaeon]
MNLKKIITGAALSTLCITGAYKCVDYTIYTYNMIKPLTSIKIEEINLRAKAMHETNMFQDDRNQNNVHTITLDTFVDSADITNKTARQIFQDYLVENSESLQDYTRYNNLHALSIFGTIAFIGAGFLSLIYTKNGFVNNTNTNSDNNNRNNNTV